MSLFLEDASLVLIPSGYKEDVVYSQKPTDGSGDLTFTRASDGTRINSSGYVENVPWNLLQQSNTFDTTWLLSGVARTSGQTGYDGSNNAWKIDKTTSDGYIYQNITTSGLLTFSVYAKAGTVDWVRLHVTSSSTYYQYINLVNGSLGGGANISSKTTSVGNGWYRCEMTFNDPSVSRVRIYPAIDNGNVSGTSGNIYIQDAQLNYGTLKPYFPTTNRQDVPRLTYEGGCPSLLLEPQRTNSVLYSEQFENAWWSKTNTSVTANAITSPDGTTTADKIIESAAGGTHFVNSTFVANQVGTFSIYAKAGERKYVTISKNSGGSNYGTATFDLENGTITQENESATSEPSIVYISNGWYRLSVYFSVSAAGFVSFGLSNSATYTPSTIGLNSYTGDGTSGAYFWGAQVELNSATYPTSYIPTTSAAVTRLVDYCYNNSMSDLIGQSEGVIFWEGTIQNTVNPILVQLIPSSGGYTNSIYLEYTGGKIQAKAYDSGSTQALLSTSATIGTRYKIAFAYAQNDFVAYVNGTNIGSDSSGTVQSGLAQIYVGGLKGAFTEAFMGTKLNQLALFKTRLTNDQLEVLTGDSYQSYTAMADSLTYYYD